MKSVQFEGFLWGLGTAIGELPPYYVARKARLLGKKHEELEEAEEEVQKDKKSKGKLSFSNKIKQLVFNHMKKHSFITVLLMASIPNPLFDLAGLTCGHLLIPFYTFFVATAIGKAIIKVHIQLVFIIFAFSKPQIELFLRKLKDFGMSMISEKLATAIENQKAKLVSGEVNESKGYIGVVWDLVLTVMIGYFLVSIVNSTVKEYYLDNQKKEIEVLKKTT